MGGRPSGGWASGRGVSAIAWLRTMELASKDLLRAANRGDAALARIGAVSQRLSLDAAQLALAREHGFTSWARLKTEVERHAILDRRDVPRLVALLAEDPALATARMEHWCAHPKGTSLLHAAVFGMTGVVDVLVAAGARIHSLEEAAAAGDVSGWLNAQAPLEARIRALVMAADHQRLPVIDQLIAAGTPVDAVDAQWGGHALRTAASNGRAASVRHLLAHGADPNLRDAEHHRTPLDWCRHSRATGDSPGHEQVEAMLAALTSPDPPPRAEPSPQRPAP